MGSSKKLMVLGASYSQIPLVEAAHKLGFSVVAASIPGDYPCFAIADEAAYVDISDPEAVLREAKRLQVDGVATCALDLGMAAIGLVCENMGLTGPSALAAKNASNKWEMKKAFAEGGVTTARFFCIHNPQELEEAMDALQFPLILKAVDQMGSRGMYRCNSKEEVRENYPKTMESTKKEYCLLEEFIQGTLYGAEGMMKNGKLVYCMPINSEVYQSFVPTSIGHSVPLDASDEMKRKTCEQVERAAKALGLDNCPIDCDLIRRDGEIYLVEMTGRPGGSTIPELVSSYYGINYYEAIVSLAMGLDVKPYFQEEKEHPACLVHMMISEESGKLKAIVNENAPSEDIFDLSFNVKAGDYIRKYTNGRDRIGQVALKGETLRYCEERLQEVLSNIKLELSKE